MKNRKKIIIIAVCAALVIAAAVCAVVLSKDVKGDEIPAGKTITLTVTTPDGSDSLEIKTSAAYLGPALREKGCIEGQKQSQGYFITAVNGIEQAPDNGLYWMFYKNDEMLMTGVDETPIADGDSFEAKLEAFEY